MVRDRKANSRRYAEAKISGRGAAQMAGPVRPLGGTQREVGPHWRPTATAALLTVPERRRTAPEGGFELLERLNRSTA